MCTRLVVIVMIVVEEVCKKIVEESDRIARFYR